MFPPIPCAHCGTNFMRHDLNPEAPKLCNNCDHKEKSKPKKEIKMTDAKILIDCSRKMQIEVEEYCTNVGITISQYFTDLHRTSFDQAECAPVIDIRSPSINETPKVSDKPKSKGNKK